jgi:hypothetical protein
MYSCSHFSHLAHIQQYKFVFFLIYNFFLQDSLIGNTTVITTISLTVIFGALIVVIVIVVKSRKNVRNQNINETELHKLQRVNVT